MKTKSFNQVGALHPVLFFAGVYIVALVLSIFICSSLFYSCNVSGKQTADTETAPVKIPEAKAPVLASVQVQQ
jgi:hypothetical protein